MTPSEMGPFWLQEKARELRFLALRTSQAYPKAPYLRDMCMRVATAYLRAASVLDEAIEREKEHLAAQSNDVQGSPTQSNVVQGEKP